MDELRPIPSTAGFLGLVMNRRTFFSTIAAGLAVAADPERLLWTPGKKLISIPTPRSIIDSESRFVFTGQLRFTPGEVICLSRDSKRP